MRHWTPNPTGKGLKPIPKKWRHTPTVARRVPKCYADLLIEVARRLDQGSLTPAQIRGLLKDNDLPPMTTITHAFDRDGTIVGSLSNYADNHPKLIPVEGLRLIPSTVAYLRRVGGGVIISNQCGPSRHVGHGGVLRDMTKLLEMLPEIPAAYWSEERNGRMGEIGVRLRQGGSLSFRLGGGFRKPGIGLGMWAQEDYPGINTYVGDLAGRSDWGNGADSDRQFAENMGWRFIEPRVIL